MPVPTTPTTPRHRRGLSNLSFSSFFSSPTKAAHTPSRPTHSRRSSKASVDSRSNTGRYSRPGSSAANDASSFALASPSATSNGLGNLADELADIYDDSEEDEEEDGESAEIEGEPDASPGGPSTQRSPSGEPSNNSTRDSGVDVTSPTKSHKDFGSPRSTRHRRDQSAQQVQDNPDVVDLSGLDDQIAEIQSLASLGVDDPANTISSALESFKDLGGQLGVESGVTRLVTAHSAISSNLASQARLIQSSMFSLISPLSYGADNLALEDIGPQLLAAMTAVPQPTFAALQTVTRLQNSSIDLIETLGHLNDTLQFSRQETSVAARRLRVVTEMVADLQKEYRLANQGIEYISDGDWDARLQQRECATQCRDVLDGFEGKCDALMDQIHGQARTIDAAAA